MTPRSGRAALLYSWAITLFLTLGTLALTLPRLGGPFDADQNTQRIIMARRPLVDILLHRNGDSRIPEGFYLLLHFFTDFGIDERTARLPAVLFGALTVGLLHRFALACFGPDVAFAAAGIVALTPGFLSQCREVAPVTLFAFFAVASCACLVRALESGRRKDALVYGVVAGLMTQTSLFAPLVMGVHAVYLLAAKPANRKPAWLGLGLAALLGCPAWFSIVNQIPRDFLARAEAREAPSLVWGNLGPGDYLSSLSDVMLPGVLTACVIALAFVGLAIPVQKGSVRYRGLWSAWALGPCLVGLLLINVMRVKGYYFLFALPGLAGLIAVGARSAADTIWPRASKPWAILLAAVLPVYCAGYWQSAEKDLYQPSISADLPSIVARIRADGQSRTVVFEPHFLSTLFIYYAAKDPIVSQDGCGSGPRDASDKRPFIDCRFDGWRVVALTHAASIPPDWEERSVQNLAELRRNGSFWYIEDPYFINHKAREAVLISCQRNEFARHSLYFCPKPS